MRSPITTIIFSFCVLTHTACAQPQPAVPSQPVAAAAPTADPAVDKLAWPREFENRGLTIRLYQPELDRWVDNLIDARAAVSVGKKGDDKPGFGVITITARTDVDKSSRMVMLRDIKVTSASFPQAKAQEAAYRAAIDDALPDVANEVPLDHLEANLATTTAIKTADAIPVKNDPPNIIFASAPTLLILIDGEPALRAIAGTQLMRAINTRALIVLDDEGESHA